MTTRFAFLLCLAWPGLNFSPLFCEANDTLFFGDHSDKFIMRWGFQEICDHVFEKKADLSTSTSADGSPTILNPARVRPGDIVMVRDLPLFFKEIYPRIRNPFVLVQLGDGSDRLKPSHLRLLNNWKIIALFTVHPTAQFHPKLHPLPLGIWQKKENWQNRDRINALFTDLRASANKDHLLYLNLDLRFKKKNIGEKNILRKQIVSLFKNQPYVLFQKNLLGFEEYISEMARCHFVLSPRGWGPDCYRTWEALLAGCIPIVSSCPGGDLEEYVNLAYERNQAKKKCPLNELYKDLPVIVVDAWEELTEEFLLGKLQEIRSKKYNIEKLYVEFWHKRVFKVRDAFMQKYKQSAAKSKPSNRVSNQSKVLHFKRPNKRYYRK